MEELRNALLTAGISARSDFPLRTRCTFRVGGNADLAVFPETTDEFLFTLRLLCRRGTKFASVGNGSNLLFADEGYRGAVVFTGRMRELTNEPDGFYALCGTPLQKLSTAARDRGLRGAAFACGIPATVGGAVFMNAGAHGGEMADLVAETDCYDIARDSCRTLRGGEHCFGYRTSVFAAEPNLVVLGARLRLKAGDREAIENEMRANMAKRRATQPLEYPSAGSAFKRPKGHSAAKLIEECGLKGCRVGGAEVSRKHAGFIVNLGNATASDVRRLVERVRQTVLEKTGIELEPEIRFLS